MTTPPTHALEDVMCELKCMRLADGWYEGRPLCCECVELVVEREAALDINPWLTLPELDDDAFRYD